MLNKEIVNKRKLGNMEGKIDVEKEIEKYADEIDALSVELSSKSDLSKEEIKLRFKETLRDLAKPSLNNMDSPCTLNENCSCK